MTSEQDLPVAVITGAAGGIGLASATRLAEDGFRVRMLDLSAERVTAAAATLAERGLTEADLQEITYEDEDDDWAEKPSIRVVGREEMAAIMADQDVVLSF